MTPPRSRPDRIARLLSGLAKQLELPFFSSASPDVRGEIDARGHHGKTAALQPDPPPPAADPKLRRIQLGEHSLDYAFRRTRRKTIGFSISASGLTIAAPRWVGINQIEVAIREREAWVLTKIADMQRHHAAIPRVRWEDGGTLPYLGEPITLRLATKTKRGMSASFDAATRNLMLSLPPDPTRAQIRDRAESWLQERARGLFHERLAVYEARLGVTHRVLRLSSAKTRWGSCSADGRILLNWRLIHFPLSSIDYVVAHELAHLKEMNHGPRFWATVATILPDYEAARAQVKNPPPELLPTL
ncbi:MAG: SprT family zinc-dependent metalloprotease [Burkholderiaceae bacterium]